MRSLVENQHPPQLTSQWKALSAGSTRVAF